VRTGDVVVNSVHRGCTVGAARRRQRRRAQVVAGLRWGSNVGSLLVGDAVLLPAAVLSVFLLVVAAGLLSPTRGRWRSARG